MRLLPFATLAIGIFFGGFGASLLLHPDTYLPTLRAPVSATVSGDVGPTPREHQLFEEHAASTTTINDIRQERAVSPGATPTSSPRSVRVPVMIYHSVRPHIEGESALEDAYDVTPELLEQELSYINNHGFTSITFADIAAYFDAGTPLPPKPVILSFDDGWRNQYVYAFPLLKKYGIKGTFFIFTNPLDYKKPHWMTWEEVSELDRAGMEIGGHTRTHPILTALATDALLDHEITGGKQILEKHLGHPITIFAYPFGSSNMHIEDRVQHAGYTLARRVRHGVWNDPEHRFEFRGVLSTDNLADFEKVLNER